MVIRQITNKEWRRLVDEGKIRPITWHTTDTGQNIVKTENGRLWALKRSES